MKKILNFNLVTMDKKDISNVTGQFWEYFVSGQSLKEYLGIPKSEAMTPFGWFQETELQKKSMRQFRMQEKSDLIDSRVGIFICAACGDIGCGSVTAKIEDHGDRIIWRDFAITNDPEAVGELFEVDAIEFERQGYFQALTQVH